MSNAAVKTVKNNRPLPDTVLAGYSGQNKVTLVRGGKDYFDLVLKMINQATHTIHLQTYIYDDDETGKMVGAALIAAAKRNVSVFLMVDGYASQTLSSAFIDELKTAGIRFRFFEPLFKSRNFYFGRRMHHKILVTDARYAITGGSNIADRYNDLPQSPAWLDYMVYVEGEAARELCILCRRTWKGVPVESSFNACEFDPPELIFSPRETSNVRVRRNDWVKRKNEISNTYIEMLAFAQKRITILCSYFLPGRAITRLLKNAAKRGIEIRVITAGKSDIMISKHAERWLYDMLLRNRIKIYEYQPAILHAKLASCDGEWVTIGSYNVNNISAYASVELNLDVRNKPFATQVEEELNRLIQNNCIPITEELHSDKTNFLIQFFRWLCYHTISLIFTMVTFYYKRIDPSVVRKTDKSHTEQ
ncbi:MAG: phospholipase [Sediminibacterium sp.]|nr:phospholipase [Sediminibacterium sp.]